MKRVAYEWGGIACALLAAVTLAYTVISLVTDRTDFELIFGDSVQIRGANGQLNFSDAFGNGQVVDDWDLSTFDPPVTSDIGKTVCGLEFRHIRFAHGGTVWYLRLPLVILFIIFTVVFGLCYMRLHKIRRIAAQHATAAESP